MNYWLYQNLKSKLAKKLKNDDLEFDMFWNLIVFTTKGQYATKCVQIFNMVPIIKNDFNSNIVWVKLWNGWNNATHNDEI